MPGAGLIPDISYFFVDVRFAPFPADPRVLSSFAFQGGKIPVRPPHLRRDAPAPGVVQRIGGGGNGAAVKTGDPQGRECSQQDTTYVQRD